jgi:hypothetical protein
MDLFKFTRDMLCRYSIMNENENIIYKGEINVAYNTLLLDMCDEYFHISHKTLAMKTEDLVKIGTFDQDSVGVIYLLSLLLNKMNTTDTIIFCITQNI